MVSPSLLRADDITYDVNQTIGAGSLTGTITTDGTIGTLALGPTTAPNILDWNLSMSDGTNTVDMTPSNSFAGGGNSGLVASATDLTFDFIPGYGIPGELENFYIQGDTTGQLCYTGWYSNCGPHGTPGISTYAVGGSGTLLLDAPMSGTQVIATVAAPEPGSAMLSLPMIGLFAWGMRKKRLAIKLAGSAFGG